MPGLLVSVSESRNESYPFPLLPPPRSSSSLVFDLPSSAMVPGSVERDKGKKRETEKWEQLPETSIHFQGWVVTHNCANCALHNSRGCRHLDVTKICIVISVLFGQMAVKCPERGHLFLNCLKCSEWHEGTERILALVPHKPQANQYTTSHILPRPCNRIDSSLIAQLLSWARAPMRD